MTRIIAHSDYPLDIGHEGISDIKGPHDEYITCTFRVIRKATKEEYWEWAKTIEGAMSGRLAPFIYELEILD